MAKHLNVWLLNTAVLGVGILLLITAIIACSSPLDTQDSTDEKPTDISGLLTYKEVSSQGFMGGSVLYNPDNPASGQVTPGATIATRLGFVTSAYVGNDQHTYTDLPEKAQYGTILISAADSHSVSFTYKAYSPQGNIITNTNHTVTLNNPIDINGDGSPDIIYQTPKRKRNGFENAVYLTFISSQEKLTTSMFAVLANQYKRGAYPNGIIGINPDGRFIVNKYDANTTSRAVISGLRKGDIVVDSIAGKYQRIMSTLLGPGARAVSDMELEDIESSTRTISFRFTDEEFTEGYTVEHLFSVLPPVIKNTYQESTLETLNLILENKDLIVTVSQTTATPIPNDIFPEVTAQIASLTADELIQLNRTFLQETYPHVCPEFINPNEGFTQVIPLASFIYGDFDSVDQIHKRDSRNAIRAASFSEYDMQRKQIKAQFNTYKEVYSKKVEINGNNKFANGVKVTLDNSFLKIGVKSAFSNTWGNVSGTIEGAAYINVDVYNDINVSFNKSVTLFSFNSSINIPVINCGPIVLNINLGMGASVPASFGFSFPMTLNNGELGFTGLYGAGVGAQIDYGVKWKKVWIITLPVPYVNTSGRSWKVENTAYYIGAAPSSISAGFNNAYIAVSPSINGTIGANISGVIGGGIGIEHGIEQRIDLAYASPTLTGTATTTAFAKLNAHIKVGIDGIPVIGFIGFKKDFDLVPPIRNELRKAVIFRKNM